MSNNEQTIQFPIALKPLLTDFVVNVLRDRIPSDQISSYAAHYFSERQTTQALTSTGDDQHERTGTFLTNQASGISEKSEESLTDDKQRRKSVWGGSPVSSSKTVVLVSSAMISAAVGSRSGFDRERSDQKSGGLRQAMQNRSRRSDLCGRRSFPCQAIRQIPGAEDR